MIFYIFKTSIWIYTLIQGELFLYVEKTAISQSLSTSQYLNGKFVKIFSQWQSSSWTVTLWELAKISLNRNSLIIKCWKIYILSCTWKKIKTKNNHCVCVYMKDLKHRAWYMSQFHRTFSVIILAGFCLTITTH